MKIIYNTNNPKSTINDSFRSQIIDTLPRKREAANNYPTLTDATLNEDISMRALTISNCCPLQRAKKYQYSCTKAYSSYTSHAYCAQLIYTYYSPFSPRFLRASILPSFAAGIYCSLARSRNTIMALAVAKCFSESCRAQGDWPPPPRLYGSRPIINTVLHGTAAK